MVACVLLAGCSEKTTIQLPFEAADITRVEMFHQVVPVSAEKKVVTQAEDMEALYKLFDGLSVTDKQTEPVARGSVTSFRFYLSDATTYDIVYCSEAVKSGRLKIPAQQADYFTSADIESNWDRFEYEAISVNESELP